MASKTVVVGFMQGGICWRCAMVNAAHTVAAGVYQ